VTARPVSSSSARDGVGPHDLLINYGDCEFYGSCTCGQMLGDRVRPDQSLDEFGQRWERHVMTVHRGCDCEACNV
jgi:hypothetical protein